MTIFHRMPFVFVFFSWVDSGFNVIQHQGLPGSFFLNEGGGGGLSFRVQWFHEADGRDSEKEQKKKKKNKEERREWRLLFFFLLASGTCRTGWKKGRHFVWFFNGRRLRPCVALWLFLFLSLSLSFFLLGFSFAFLDPTTWTSVLVRAPASDFDLIPFAMFFCLFVCLFFCSADGACFSTAIGRPVTSPVGFDKRKHYCAPLLVRLPFALQQKKKKDQTKKFSFFL